MTSRPVRVHADAAAGGRRGSPARSPSRWVATSRSGPALCAADARGAATLLAHELAHVVQQGAAAPLRSGQVGRVSVAPCRRGGGGLQRFADVDHHVIETRRAGEGVHPGTARRHRGGKHAPRLQPASGGGQRPCCSAKSAFGGYARHEHFDNFVFDRAADRWVSQDEFDRIWDDQTRRWTQRSPGIPPHRGKPRQTPLAYLEAELVAAVQRDTPDAGAFAHLGNALHDQVSSPALQLRRAGAGRHLARRRTRHPFAERARAELEDSILGSITDAGSAAFFNDRFAWREGDGIAAVARTARERTFTATGNHLLAMTLATLVIRQIGLMLREAFALGTRQREVLRPRPDRRHAAALLPSRRSDKDRWWETMLSEDPAA